MALGYHPRIQLIISRGIGQWEAQSHNHDDGQHIRVGGTRPLAVTHSGSLCARLGDETLAGPRGACSDTIAPAMLSHAQEARVQDVLGNHPPGTIQTYCLEHPAAVAKIPPGHLADLFVRSLREHGACQTQYGGICDADAHETDRVLIWGPLTPMAGRPAEPNTGAGSSS